MSNQPYYGRGGGGRGNQGGYQMRGRGMGMGGGGHPMQGMMGHQGQGRGGGMMMGDRGDPSMRGGGPGWGFDPDPRADRGYDRGGFEMDMGGPHMVGRPMGGPSPRRVPMPPGGRGISPTGGPPQMMDESDGPPSNKLPPSSAVRYANDCEIIVTAKAQQQYAEMIEKEIKDCSLNVDLMFPKPDVKLSNFIDNIASMGTIFAVVIRPDNENHRSVSVHVLRGPPKPEVLIIEDLKNNHYAMNVEHRNMPLTAAYQLIKERYYELKRKEIGVIPENIKKILKFLLDDRQLTDQEYATVVRFLQERRRKQTAFEKRTNNVVGDENVNEIIDTPEGEEIQQRVMAIMNIVRPGQDTKPAVPEGEKIGNLFVPRPKQPLGALDSDPKVQNAINTLMNPEFLSALNNASNQGQGGSSMGRGGGGMGRGQAFGPGGGF